MRSDSERGSWSIDSSQLESREHWRAGCVSPRTNHELASSPRADARRLATNQRGRARVPILQGVTMSDLEFSLPLTARASESLQVFLLGTVDFDSALPLQERFRDEVSQRGDRLGGLFLCEHPPVVTIGREGSQTHLRRDVSEFNKLGIEVRWLNRGGGAWMQCPGQIAIYPIVPLRRLGFGLAEYRQRLELAVLDVCRELHVAAHCIDEEPGVFCSLGQLATVGVAVRSWVTTHGLTLNVRPDLSLLRTTRPNTRPATDVTPGRSATPDRDPQSPRKPDPQPHRTPGLRTIARLHRYSRPQTDDAASIRGTVGGAFVVPPSGGPA